MPENNTTTTGVYTCYENQFKIGDSSSSKNTIADCETFEVAFDNGIEEWTPFTTEGWVRKLMTAKSITITVTGKRNVGDTGNDLVAGLAFLNGRSVEKYFEWEFPDGTVIAFSEAVINVTNIGAGDSTAVAPLEFEVHSNGKPTVTEAP